MPVRDRRPAPLALGRPAAKPCHLGVRPGLVNEDQPVGVEVELSVEPVLAPGSDVRARLLARVSRLFLCVRPRLVKKYHTVAGQARTPCSANSRAAISCNAISLSADTRPRMKASCASSFEPGGWPSRAGFKEPSARHCWCHLIAEDGATENRAAAARADIPSSIAETTRRRSSIPYGRTTSASETIWRH
jgi:hypothetical protein